MPNFVLKYLLYSFKRKIYGICKIYILPILLFSNNISFAQQITVKGTVTSEEGPLPGANILVEGSTYGNISNLNGEYSLVVPNPESILVFSSVGYKTQRIKVGNRDVIDVFMVEDIAQLDEIVVTGYTSQTRKNLSGPVSVVDPEEIREVPANSVAEQLQGRAAGVNVLSSGAPGGEVSVRIRGYGTVSESMSEPLYIVDGIPLESSMIETLNPNDVESIQILKDATTASIYGARAANGVIIITTRSGKASDGPEISFDSYFGVQNVSNLPDLLNPDELATITRTGMENAGDTSLYHPQYLPINHINNNIPWGLPDYLWPAGQLETDTIDESSYDLETNPITRANLDGTDWLREIFQPAVIQSYNLGVSGGNQIGKYAISLGYFDQEGIVKHTGYSKLMARINTLFNFKGRIRIGETLGISYQVKDNQFNDNNSRFFSHAAIQEAFSTPEIKPVYDIGGNYTGNKLTGVTGSNPVATLERGKDNHEKRIHMMGSFFLEWDILKELTFKTSFNPVINLTYENKYFIPKAVENADPGNASLFQNSWNLMNWSWYNTLTFYKTFAEKHHLQVMAGSEAIDNQVTQFGAAKDVYYLEDIDYRELNAGEHIINNEGYSSEWALFSLFGKIDYQFENKYILSATFRRDGSSRFGRDNRYAFFPAISAAWRISAEPFLQNVHLINDLKIRAGWGQTGNQNIGDYIIFNSFRKDIQTAGYDIRGDQNNAEVGVRPKAFGNPDAKWETTTTIDIGLDFTILDNRLSGTLDLYQRITTDMLIQARQRGLLGLATLPWKNVGEIENRGIDWSLEYHSNPANEFSWDLGVNFSHYRNKVIQLSYPGEMIFPDFVTPSNSPIIITENEPVSSYYGYQIQGIFMDTLQVKNAPVHDENWSENPSLGVGRWIFEDIDKNGKIDDSDRKVIGSPHPDFTVGLNMNFSYKRFDLNLFWYGSYGNEIFNVNKLQTDIWDGTNRQKGSRILQSWGLPGVDNTKAVLPEINDSAPVRERLNNSYMVEDGSFLRLKQIRLGYSFETSRWKGIKRFRIYVQGNNLITWTRYLGLDPEVAGRDESLGYDWGYYPNPKIYLVGLNLIF